MIRTIDNQMMLQHTTEVAKTVGNKINTDEHSRAFKADMEKERIADEQHSVMETQAAEHRRIQDDENRKNKKENYKEEKGQTKTARTMHSEEEEPERLNTWNMGKEIDIIV